MNDPKPMSQNQAITVGAKLNWVLAQLERRRAEIEPILPADLSFDAFHSTINQALRANPDLIDCEPRSIVNACVKAAYDGLRVDGKEACIVWEMGTPPGSPRNSPKVKMARYMSMYQGLVQQVLRGGMVLACEADVIYENDKYQLLRGTQSGIFHEPLLTGDRGEMIAVYNVATLPGGVTTFAYLTADQVLDIQKESKSGWNVKDECSQGVWKRWPREQWKKTAIRQHRKTLPVGRDPVRDVDMADDFPQFDRTAAHPMLGAPRPVRGGAKALPFDPDANGVALDLGGGADLVHQERGGDREEPRGQQTEQRQERAKPTPADDGSGLPANPQEWAVYQRGIEAKIGSMKVAAAVNALWREERERLEQAPQAVNDALAEKFTDRLADLAGDDDGDAGRAGDKDDNRPTGEDDDR